MDDPTLIDGRYKLGIELGAGAFGSVYKATHYVLGEPMRDVAVKLFKGAAVTETNVRQMMTDALAILALLDRLPDWEVRQHFVTVYDLGVTREAPARGFVVMELVRGGSLEGRLRDFGKFTLAGTFHHLHQLTRALAFMHDEGFVHSDLKPANVFVYRGRERELVKVGDFGLAGRYLGPLSQGGPAGGTMSYLPPEALQGLGTTPAGDVFSLGVIGYELLTGSNPYNRVGHTLKPDSPTHNADMNRMQLASRASGLSLNRDDFPELADAKGPLAHLAPLLDVINKMVAPSVAERYATARRAFEDLERIAAGLPPVLRTGSETVSKIDDPAAALVGRFEGCLNRREWNEAAAAATELAKLRPAKPDAYLLLGRVPVAQAGHMAAKGSPDAVVHKFLRQAVAALEKGLKACPAAADRREVRNELVNVLMRLGDVPTAEFHRRQAD